MMYASTCDSAQDVVLIAVGAGLQSCLIFQVAKDMLPHWRLADDQFCPVKLLKMVLCDLYWGRHELNQYRVSLRYCIFCNVHPVQPAAMKASMQNLPAPQQAVFAQLV